MADFKHIVRVVNTDLDGRKQIAHALTKIKGVGRMYANSICLIANVDKHHKTGELPEEQIKKLNEIIRNPSKYNVPDWMLNRRKDTLTGKDKHLLTSDLDFTRQQDFRRMSKTKSYRGLRLQAGLTVRGQRTKSNFRRNKGKVTGVKRSKA